MKGNGAEMTSSIICNEEVCYKCGKLVGLQRHHCLHGTANRKLAEIDGLWVYLCVDCHRDLHDRNTAFDGALMRLAERRYLDHYNKTIPDFIARYGKNYL